MRIMLLSVVMLCLSSCKSIETNRSSLKDISKNHAYQYRLNGKLANRCMGQLDANTKIKEIKEEKESFWLFSNVSSQCKINSDKGPITQFVITKRSDRPRGELLVNALRYAIETNHGLLVRLGDRSLTIQGKPTREVVAMNVGGSGVELLKKVLKEESSDEYFVSSIDIASDGTLVFYPNSSKEAYIIRSADTSGNNEMQIEYLSLLLDSYKNKTSIKEFVAMSSYDVDQIVDKNGMSEMDYKRLKDIQDRREETMIANRERNKPQPPSPAMVKMLFELERLEKK